MKHNGHIPPCVNERACVRACARPRSGVCSSCALRGSSSSSAWCETAAPHRQKTVMSEPKTAQGNTEQSVPKVPLETFTSCAHKHTQSGCALQPFSHKTKTAHPHRTLDISHYFCLFVSPSSHEESVTEGNAHGSSLSPCVGCTKHEKRKEEHGS